jgi:protein phosphatase 2C
MLHAFDFFQHGTILAGHTLLKPAVICEPEITITTRSEDDDCLILASDGLWDVVSNQVACDIAQVCLEDKSNEAAERCARAAIVMASLATARHCPDDISAIVLDLKMRG